MGLGLFRSSCSCSYEKQEILPNPNPKNFKIIWIEEGFNFTIAKIHYPDCENYEGNKILVWEGKVAKKIVELKELDPHFCNQHLSPIARFAPTEEGIKIALSLDKIYNEKT